MSLIHALYRAENLYSLLSWISWNIPSLILRRLQTINWVYYRFHRSFIIFLGFLMGLATQFTTFHENEPLALESRMSLCLSRIVLKIPCECNNKFLSWSHVLRSRESHSAGITAVVSILCHAHKGCKLFWALIHEMCRLCAAVLKLQCCKPKYEEEGAGFRNKHFRYCCSWLVGLTWIASLSTTVVAPIQFPKLQIQATEVT